MLAALPIVDPADDKPREIRPERPLRAIVVHLMRVALLATILLLIHRRHQQRLATEQTAKAAIRLELAAEVFPQAISTELDQTGATAALDSDGERIGTLVQTSPASDRIMGFSGPTNMLLVFDPHDRIVAVRILSSRDTREHAERVAADPKFLPSYVGLTRVDAAERTDIDGVSGATLTSLAIAESIAHRLGGAEQSLRFPEPLAVEDVVPMYPQAGTILRDADLPSVWHARDDAGGELGIVLRGSPAVDNIIGYQGPTDLILGLTGPAHAQEGATIQAANETNERVIGIRLGRSYDNEPYVGYVRKDRYFFRIFVGKTVQELAELDLQAARVEGVSGATMTSLAVADGIVATARRQRADAARVDAARLAAGFRPAPRDWGTIAVTLFGMLLGLSRWRGRRWLRWPFLAVLVGYLGFINGDLVSQALLAGWAGNGIPWRTMLGPLVLSLAAILVPIVSGRNIYCSHLCPHGAAQQLLMARLPWRWQLGPQVHRLLATVPGLLLIWVAFVVVTGLAFSLVDIEPFDAYVPTIAGWPTLVLFVGGLAAALFVPMAYCQYGCPTGALLGWLRRNSRSDAINRGDVIACFCLLLALCWA